MRSRVETLFIESSLTKYLFLQAFGYQSIYSLRRAYTNDLPVEGYRLIAESL